jgi:hypothetical protein
LTLNNDDTTSARYTSPGNQQAQPYAAAAMGDGARLAQLNDAADAYRSAAPLQSTRYASPGDAQPLPYATLADGARLAQLNDDAALYQAAR